MDSQPLARKNAAMLKRLVVLPMPWASAWHTARTLILYYCIFSLVGHWMEMGYSTLIRIGLIPGTYSPSSAIWLDWFTPFYVYGCGAVVCAMVLVPIKRALQRRFDGSIPLCLSFVTNALVCSAIELINGLLYNQPLADGVLPLWDYSNLICNFQGQICLQTSLAFGLVATLMVWVALPKCEALCVRITPAYLNILFVCVVCVFAFLSLR